MRRAALILSLSGGMLWGCSLPPVASPPEPAPSSPPVGLDPAQLDATPLPSPAVNFTVQRILPREVKVRMARGERVVIADVRSRASYDLSHIEGAISLPAKEYQVWGPTLSREQTIVFY